MRYINKEYGFTFRPPYYSKFYQETDSGPAVTADNFPGRYFQGAGFDYSAVNGCMLIGPHGSMWGIKVLYQKNGKWLDGKDMITGHLPTGANTADGSFAHIVLGDISVKWAKLTEQGIIIKISCDKKRRVRLICYPCFGMNGELSIEGSVVKGRAPYAAVIPGTVELTMEGAVIRDRFLVVDEGEREYFLLSSFNKPSAIANGAFNEAIMEFVLNARQHDIYFYAAVGESGLYEKVLPSRERVAHQLQTSELRYGVNKPGGGGTLGSVAERMSNSILWSRMYYPYFKTTFFTPRRRELDDNFNIKGIEECCGAILGAAVNPEAAFEQALITFGDRILGLLTLWNTYLRGGDRQKLKQFFPRLKVNYPVEAEPVLAGPDKKEVAYGWEDSPLKERKNVLPMFSLDLSCIKLLNLELMARMARETENEAGEYEKAAAVLRKRINEFFFDPSRRLYCNRYVNGDFAHTVGATSFYPLIAGAVTADRVKDVLKTLVDPARFWGEYVVPTLTKNHREYGKKGKPDNNGKRQPPYLNYRGSIVPYVNYLIYLGLTRYRADRTAADMAKKCAALWLDNENDAVSNFAKYAPNGKVQKTSPSSAGNLLAFIAVEELLGVEYFSTPARIRFGTLLGGVNTLGNYKLLGKTYSISVTDETTVLIANKETIFRADGGKCKVRNFFSHPGGGEFEINAAADLTVSFNGYDERTKKTTRYFFIAKKGLTRVKADNGIIDLEHTDDENLR